MATVSKEQLDHIYAFAVQLGKDAGNMLMDAAKSRFGSAGRTEEVLAEKENAVDIVTKTDEGASRDRHWN
jgi:myo-inositol-1(or 4)-monophosphatase